MELPIYLYTPTQRGVFVEVYFPKKVALQATIFTALAKGYNEQTVKKNLKTNARALLRELADYPTDLFDPYRYGKLEKPSVPETSLAKARKRIDMYSSPFKGWSMYEVDGVFFDKRGRVYEERTQVVRLLFRFVNTRSARLARQWDCEDILRSIIFFIMRERGQIKGETPWDEAAKKRFMETHEALTDPVRQGFAERNFTRIAQEVRKWMDDCSLFTFGYLVRKFSKKVLETARPEEEIWVTGLFGLTVNAIRKTKQNTMTIERRIT